MRWLPGHARTVPQQPVAFGYVGLLIVISVVRLASLAVRRTVCLYVMFACVSRLLSVLSSGTSGCRSRCCSGPRARPAWTSHTFGSLFAVLYSRLCVVRLRVSVLFELFTCLIVVCPLVCLSVHPVSRSCECWPQTAGHAL